MNLGSIHAKERPRNENWDECIELYGIPSLSTDTGGKDSPTLWKYYYTGDQSFLYSSM